MDSSTLSALMVSLVVLVAVVAGGALAYNSGALDPYIEQIGKYLAKAKAKAAFTDGQKQFQEEGMKAMGDQTDAAQDAVGSVGGGFGLGDGGADLKKRF
ncbi:hypothetical protein AK830_g7679 [Neonectria ditissima]|uniref:Uncharacterized protein n=1 Tax=Neonectria ditissima TaxID=78410 RepID=A0A0P7BFR4_9HYPO|nr:hypothetical protein AK830_g7679 [Neonectria ditissima]